MSKWAPLSENSLTFAKKQEKTLALACETFIPSIEENTSSSEFFRRGISSEDQNEILRIFNEEYSEDQRTQIKQLLNLFENRFLNLILNQTFKAFSSMDSVEKEKYLYEKFGKSSLALKRKAFQALKRQICYVNYGYAPNSRQNANWNDIGYSPRSKSERGTVRSPLLSTIPEKDERISCDVCIVGSGAGGAVFAEYLAGSGLQVIVVESGSYEIKFGEEYEMTSKLFEQKGRATTDDLSFSLLEGHTAGGSTTVNWNTSIKPSMWLREEWEKVEGISGLTGKEFEGCIEYIWGALKVTRNESQLKGNNRVLYDGCKNLGYKEPEDFDIIYRNADGCRERCSFCSYGCEYGCKQSTTAFLLPSAQTNGARFIFDSEVDQVIIENGRAAGVRAVCKGKNFEVKSRAVVIAAGSINTPAILLRSGLKKNAGINLRLDPTTAVSGLFDEKIKMWEGPPQTVKITRGLNLDGMNNGYWIEAAPAHPALYASAAPWTSGRKHKEFMLDMQFSSATIVLVRDTSAGRVSIDKHGRPVCNYRLNSKDQEHMIQGMVEAARVLAAAGARRVSTLHSDGFSIEAKEKLSPSDIDRLEAGIRKRKILPNGISLFSAHIMSSARMGREDRSFCDDNAESYELPSLFIGDASVMPTPPGINPMITIMSLARRNAQRIRPKISKG
ncbi:MAG: GMC family oxidoreductase N-terminal domain-containing protein [Nitrososphaerales archaeon]